MGTEVEFIVIGYLEDTKYGRNGIKRKGNPYFQ